MQIYLPCMQCGAKEAVAGRLGPNFVPVQNGNLYTFTCKNGHLNKTYILTAKCDLLFDKAVNALIDGYFSEAVTNFASSLERFYELLLRLMCGSDGIGYETYAGMWKLISNQSERQLGAFYAVYLLTFHAVPPKMPDLQIAFRNKVIHKGHIASAEEAKAYGQSVLNHMRDTLAPTLENVVGRSPILNDDYAKHEKDPAVAKIPRDELTVMCVYYGVARCAVLESTVDF